MKRILVTGATGFIGRHCLAPLLAKGYEVHAVSCRTADTDVEPAARWHQADLLQAAQIDGLMAEVAPSHLLHFAWYAVPGKYARSAENLRWLKSSLDLLQSFAARGGQRAVFAGSCFEYDWRFGYCSENLTPTRPSTLYGACKRSLQEIVGCFSEQSGLSSAWGRIFYLYGSHEAPGRLVPSVITTLLRKQSFNCTQGGQLRDFLHVQDVADAFVALLESGAEGPVNIGCGSPAAVRDVVCMVADALGRRDLLNFGALPTPPGEPPLLVADVTRLRQLTGWQPKISLRGGLTETVEWWKRALNRSPDDRGKPAEPDP